MLRYFRRAKKEEELSNELESYLAITIDENVAAGMTEDEAHAAALRKLGNMTRIKETVRDMNTLNFFEDCWSDLRHALRLVRLNPSFFIVAILSLALGIGANTAIFQLLNAVRLQALPVPHPEQLVELRIAENDHCCAGNFSSRRSSFTYPQWEQIRDRQQGFSSVVAFSDARFNLADRGESKFAEGWWVSGNFYSALGVRPALGRLFNEQDDQKGCGSPGAVLSYTYWQRAFGGDPGIIGRVISIERHPLAVVGVSAAGFYGPEVGRSYDIAVPLCADTLLDGDSLRVSRRDAWWLAVIGRLNPNWTLDRAKAQLGSISSQVFETTIPENYRAEDAKWYKTYKLTAEPAASGVSQLREAYEHPLWLLLGIAAAVLLIACANLANLMLARASVREREMAVRIAIGAGRARLIRQMLAECALLTIAGALLGAFLAQALSRYLLNFISTSSDPMFLDLALDWRMLAFTSTVAVLTCLLFGIAPALRAASTSPGVALKAGGRAITADRSRFGLRRALVVVQVALSMVLVAGALLFGRSLHKLTTLDTGLRGDGLIVAQLANTKVPTERRGAFYSKLLERLLATPGVESAASASIVQLSGSGWNPPLEMIGVPAPPSGPRLLTWFNRVSPRYFQTMGTPLLAGRDFNEHDTAAAPEVAIVTQKFVDHWLQGANPIGKQFRNLPGPGQASHVYEIVGVVKDSKYLSLTRQIEPLVFLASSQEIKPPPGTNFIIRPRAGQQVTAALKDVILAENPDSQTVIQSFETQVEESILRERLMAMLSGFFGILAALLASVGLYGVISYMVAKRRNEIGIRVALGASQGSILQLVFREAGVLAGIGIVVGLALAAAGGTVTKSLLYGLEPQDPMTLAIAGGLLASVSLLASFLPAFRASRLDPVQALRED